MPAQSRLLARPRLPRFRSECFFHYRETTVAEYARHQPLYRTAGSGNRTSQSQGRNYRADPKVRGDRVRVADVDWGSGIDDARLAQGKGRPPERGLSRRKEFAPSIDHQGPDGR